MKYNLISFKKLNLIFTVLLVLLTACQTAEPTPTPTPESTATPTPTWTEKTESYEIEAKVQEIIDETLPELGGYTWIDEMTETNSFSLIVVFNNKIPRCTTSYS